MPSDFVLWATGARFIKNIFGEYQTYTGENLLPLLGQTIRNIATIYDAGTSIADAAQNDKDAEYGCEPVFTDIHSAKDMDKF